MLVFAIAFVNFVFYSFHTSCESVFGSAPDFLLDLATFPSRFWPEPPCVRDWDGKCKLVQMYLDYEPVVKTLVSVASPLDLVSYAHFIVCRSYGSQVISPSTTPEQSTAR